MPSAASGGGQCTAEGGVEGEECCREVQGQQAWDIGVRKDKAGRVLYCS